MFKPTVLFPLLALFFGAVNAATDDEAYVFQYCTCAELLVFTPGQRPIPACITQARHYLRDTMGKSPNEITGLLVDTKGLCENSCENFCDAPADDTDSPSASPTSTPSAAPSSEPTAAPVIEYDVNDILVRCDCKDYYGCGSDEWQECLDSRGETLSMNGVSISIIFELFDLTETYCQEEGEDAYCGSDSGGGEE